MADEARELAEILDTVGEKLPALINALKGTLYSVQAGRELGQAVGAFYRELMDAGIPNEPALQMVTSYMGVLSGLMQQAQGGKGEITVAGKRLRNPGKPDVEDGSERG